MAYTVLAGSQCVSFLQCTMVLGPYPLFLPTIAAIEKLWNLFSQLCGVHITPHHATSCYKPRGWIHTTLFKDNINFQKPGMLACSRHIPGLKLKAFHVTDLQVSPNKNFKQLSSIYKNVKVEYIIYAIYCLTEKKFILWHEASTTGIKNAYRS